MTDQFKRERNDEEDVTDIGRAFKAGAEWARDQLKERIAQLELQSTNYRDAFDTSRTAFDLLKESAEQFQAERDQLQERVKKLEAENARLQEAISYLPKVPTKPYEQELARRIVEAEAERDQLEERVTELEAALEQQKQALLPIVEKWRAASEERNRWREMAEKMAEALKRIIDTADDRCIEGSSALEDIARNSLAEYEKLRDGE